MASIGQKEAVVNAVVETLGDRFTSGVTNVKGTLTAEELTQVRDVVHRGIMAGDVTYNKDKSDSKAVARYVNGMVDNHLRKAKELNGGSKYAASGSGSSRGPRDPQLNALRKLSKNYADGSEEKAKVLSAISTRESEIVQQRASAKAVKAVATATIDFSSLPEDLSQLIQG